MTRSRSKEAQLVTQRIYIYILYMQYAGNSPSESFPQNNDVISAMASEYTVYKLWDMIMYVVK